jgi:hypothetical protein
MIAGLGPGGGVMHKRVLRLLIMGVLFALAAAPAAAGANYIVLYKQEGVPADAAETIERAGGSLAYSYDMIGGAIARSDSPSLAADARLEAVADTSGYGVRLAVVNTCSVDSAGMEADALTSTA